MGECKAGRRRNIFLIIICSVSLLRVGDPRGGSQFFMCVAQFYTQCFVDNLD